jgi:putative Mg2+ transporter-C (MgtC) family protein
MLVSKYGFGDVLTPGRIVLDPSRMAAQIVSGIGFIGGGLIFVRRAGVKGLTTAASIWLVAAVGMAAGASLWILAVAATLGYFLVAYGYAPAARRLPGARVEPSLVHLHYREGRGVLRRALAESTRRGFTIAEVAIEPDAGQRRSVTVELELHGTGSAADLASTLSALEGVTPVRVGDLDEQVA